MDAGGGDASPDLHAADVFEEGPGLGIDYSAFETGIEARFDPDSDEWTSTGWPSDRYRNADGQVDLSNFPNPDSELLATYLELGEEVLNGFGLNSAAYFQFDGFLDADALPTPLETMAPDAPVQWVNVSAYSSRYGERMPLHFRIYDYGLDLYYLPGTLAMRPQYGFPLEEGSTYCVMVTRLVRDEDGHHLAQNPRFAEALDSDPTLAPLRAWLPSSGLRREDLAVATCFTTQTATVALRRAVDVVATLEVPHVLQVEEPVVFGEFHGVYLSPNFQTGDKPYSSGGGFTFGEDGQPIVQNDEEIRFMLTVPRDASMPPAGWPVVLYAHGTGGDYESCRSIASDVVSLGMALLCIDQPLHGSRGAGYSETEIVNYSFNFVNPRSGRTGFRQSAIDTVMLARMVVHGRFEWEGADTESGLSLTLDPDRLAFFGHSHGGLSGALVLGVEDHIKIAVLSGAAGILVETILRRKDPFDISAIVQALLGVWGDDLDSFHPAMTLIQTLVDATDPINYAPYWLKPAGTGAPKHVFVTEGTSDHASPAVATDALASAAGLPQLFDMAKLSLGHVFQGLDAQPLPASLNAGFGDFPVTGGLKQWQEANHWAAFNRSEARTMWRAFLGSFAQGEVPSLSTDAGSLKPVVIPAGEACGEGGYIPADALPLMIRSTTSMAYDDFAIGTCLGAATLGAGERDVAFRFVPEVTGEYRFTLLYPSPLDTKVTPTGPDLLALVTGCEGEPLCLAASSKGSVVAELEAGVEVAVLVDASDIAHRGAFTLKVEADCLVEPCGNRECGDWGCATCGVCESGAKCSAEGICKAAPPGDTCADPIILGDLPVLVTGDTRPFLPDYHYSAGSCSNFASGYGKASGDIVYRFDPPGPGIYVVSLDADFDASVFVRNVCEGDGTCLQGNRQKYSGERLLLDLPDLQPLFVFVDGASNSADWGGHFSLRISSCVPDCSEANPCGSDGCGGVCGSCGPGLRCHESPDCHPIPYSCTAASTCDPIPVGDQCDDPFLVEAFPFTHQGTTAGFDPDLSYPSGACSGESGSWGASSSDVVFALTAPASGLFEFKLKTQLDASLYLVTECADVAESCIGAKTVKGKKGYRSLYRELTAGQNLFAVVDGGSTFTFKVSACQPSCDGKLCGSDGCGGSCGSCEALETCSASVCVVLPGSGCEAARPVGALPWTHSHSTSGYGAMSTDLCSDVGLGSLSKDVFYRFTPAQTGHFSAILEAQFDGTVYAISSCSAEQPACLPNVMAGVPMVHTTFEAQGGEEILLVVDGADTGGGAEAGKYTLRVEEACFPQCDDKNCGDDGCGRPCGVCSYPADVCDSGGVCRSPQEAAGASVESAFMIPELPFSGVGDTSGTSNHFSTVEGQCLGYVTKGRFSSDQFWRLPSSGGGMYRVVVTPEGFDAWASVHTLQEDGTLVCVAASDTPGEEQLWFMLAGGEETFIIVDGAANRTNDAGTYTITAERLD